MPTSASATLLATREAEAGSTMVEKDLGASLDEAMAVGEDLEPSASKMLLLLPPGSQSVRTTEGKAYSDTVIADQYFWPIILAI